MHRPKNVCYITDSKIVTDKLKSNDFITKYCEIVDSDSRTVQNAIKYAETNPTLVGKEFIFIVTDKLYDNYRNDTNVINAKVVSKIGLELSLALFTGYSSHDIIKVNVGESTYDLNLVKNDICSDTMGVIEFLIENTVEDIEMKSLYVEHLYKNDFIRDNYSHRLKNLSNRIGG